MGSAAPYLQSDQPVGLYIHIPFCRSKCPYCDFASVTDLSLQPDFVEALLIEIRLTAAAMPAVDTVYIGGGTPSTLPTQSLQRIMSAVRAAYRLLPDPEVTLEVNPGTVSAGSLKAYRGMGVNRLNIGIQSFQPENLEMLGRVHTAEQATDAISAARQAGFDNLGVDLMYALPRQNLDMWGKDLQQAAGHGVEHLSCYTLTFEAGTRIEKDRRAGRIQPPAETLVADMIMMAVEQLSDAGYHRYEVSNFARSADLRSRHNQKYWSLAPYRGLGPSAHSWASPERYWNKKDLPAYIADLRSGRLPVDDREQLDRSQMITEAVYLGLRTAAGIDGAWFAERFEESFERLFGDLVRRFESEGIMRSAGGRFALTDYGMLLLDSIATEFVSRL